MMPYRVYTAGGKVAHVLLTSPNSTDSVALCGRSSWPTMWRGTGNPAERETATDMPSCLPCGSALEREAERQRRIAEAQTKAFVESYQTQQSQTRGER